MSMVGNTVRGDKKASPEVGTNDFSHSEIKELVRQAASGSFQAFGNLYSVYMDRIYRYVYYQVKDKMTAEDITEEVFVKAWKVIKSCHGKEDTFQAWLYRIAHNHLADCLRSNGHVTSLDKDYSIDFPDPHERIESGAEYQELLSAIAGLPETQRQVVVLKFIEGFDNSEISRILGKNEGAIRITQMRALDTLRKKLGEVRQEDGQKISCNAG